MLPRTLAAGVVVVVASGFGAAVVSAHADADVVAVAAGDEAVVRLRPNHGCGESPTVEVRVRAPLDDAVAGDVEGWTASAKQDGDGNTVLTWSGGELPADETGAFPVEFVVPDTPGELLTFPAIQTCANGEELAWIEGDPDGEYPVPRLLVLPAGSEPAATIDDVPLDAPGRELLEANLDLLEINQDLAVASTSDVAGSVPDQSTAPDDTDEKGPDRLHDFHDQRLVDDAPATTS